MGEETHLIIEFPNLIAPKITAMGTVSFQVKVNEEFIWCEISIEALRHCFSHGPLAKNDLLQAFHSGRKQIEHVARQYLEENQGHPVLLMISDFSKIV
jgi:hypothetical protein